MKLAILLIACSLYGGTVRAQNDWVLAAQKQGIKVYVKEEAGSKVKALKVQCELAASASQVVALLVDIPATTQWMPNTKTCYITRQISNSDFYYYTEVDLPWPLANRDFFTHLQVSQDPITKVVTVNAPAVPETVAEKEGIVRIRQSKGTWTITPSTNDRVQLEYCLMVDPGGCIPAAIVNYFATDASVKVIKNMQQTLQSPKYLNARLAYIR